MFLQVYELHRADGKVQHVNPGEFVAVERGDNPVAVAGFLRCHQVGERRDVGDAGIIPHHVQFMKVDAHERDVEFVPPQRGTVVFDVQFRHVEEQRAAEIRRVIELETIER